MTETTTHRPVQMPLANDLYNIDSLLSEEERMVRDTVRKFVNERVMPIIGEHFEPCDQWHDAWLLLATECTQ